MKILALAVMSACLLAAGCSTHETTVVEKPVPAVAPAAAVVPAPAGSTVVYTAPSR